MMQSTVRRQNSTSAEEVARFKRLFPNPSWLAPRRTSGHPKLVPTFPWIYNYLMVTKCERLVFYLMLLGSSRPYPWLILQKMYVKMINQLWNLIKKQDHRLWFCGRPAQHRGLQARRTATCSQPHSWVWRLNSGNSYMILGALVWLCHRENPALQNIIIIIILLISLALWEAIINIWNTNDIYLENDVASRKHMKYKRYQPWRWCRLHETYEIQMISTLKMMSPPWNIWNTNHINLEDDVTSMKHMKYKWYQPWRWCRLHETYEIQMISTLKMMSPPWNIWNTNDINLEDDVASMKHMKYEWYQPWRWCRLHETYEIQTISTLKIMSPPWNIWNTNDINLEDYVASMKHMKYKWYQPWRWCRLHETYEIQMISTLKIMSPPWNIWNTNDINLEDDVASMKHMKYKRYQPWRSCRLHETYEIQMISTSKMMSPPWNIWNTNDINLEDDVASMKHMKYKRYQPWRSCHLHETYEIQMISTLKMMLPPWNIWNTNDINLEDDVASMKHMKYEWYRPWRWCHLHETYEKRMISTLKMMSPPWNIWNTNDINLEDDVTSMKHMKYKWYQPWRWCRLHETYEIQTISTLKMMSPPWNIWNTNDINLEDDVASMKHMKYKRYQPWRWCRLHETYEIQTISTLKMMLPPWNIWNTNDINLEDDVTSRKHMKYKWYQPWKWCCLHETYEIQTISTLKMMWPPWNIWSTIDINLEDDVASMKHMKYKRYQPWRWCCLHETYEIQTISTLKMMSPPWNIWNTNDINLEDDVASMKHMKYKRYQPWRWCCLHETCEIQMISTLKMMSPPWNIWNTNDINLEDDVASMKHMKYKWYQPWRWCRLHETYEIQTISTLKMMSPPWNIWNTNDINLEDDVASMKHMKYKWYQPWRWCCLHETYEIQTISTLTMMSSPWNIWNTNDINLEDDVASMKHMKYKRYQPWRWCCLHETYEIQMISTLKMMSPPSSWTVGRILVSSNSLIIATVSSSSAPWK